MLAHSRVILRLPAHKIHLNNNPTIFNSYQALGKLSINTSLFFQRSFITRAHINNSFVEVSLNRRAKANKGGKGKKDSSEEEEGETFDLDQVKKLLQPSIESLKKDLDTIRVVRARPAVLEKLLVETGKSKVPLTSVAQVTAKDPQVLEVHLFDEELIKPVLKAIRDADSQFTPSQEGNIIKVKTPKITTEYRASLEKLAQQEGEKRKNQIRNIRKNGMDLMKKAKLSEDETRRVEKQIQGLIEDAVKNVTALVNAKISELSSV